MIGVRCRCGRRSCVIPCRKCMERAEKRRKALEEELRELERKKAEEADPGVG